MSQREVGEHKSGRVSKEMRDGGGGGQRGTRTSVPERV